MTINFRKLLNLFIGATMIFPLYFRLSSFMPELVEIKPFLYIPGVKLIPLAFLGFLIIIFLNIKKINIPDLTLLFLLDIIIFISMINIPFNRVIALLIPLNFLYIISYLIKNKSNSIAYLSIGHVIGIIITYFSNIISAIKYFPYNGNIFGYEIYSFYVSYSAIASIICGTTLLTIVCVRNLEKKILITLTVLCTLSFFVLLLPQRRAAFVDIVMSLILIFIYIAINLYHKKINYLSILFIPISILLVSISINNIYSPLSNITDGRLISYVRAFSFLKTNNINGFLFGYTQGFADYSNLFLELFVRTGIIGSFIYIFASCFIIRYFLKVLKKNLNYEMNSAHKIPLIFILSSFLIGNIANINVSLPYYSINLTMILLSYSCLLSRVNSIKRLELNTNNKRYALVNRVN